MSVLLAVGCAAAAGTASTTLAGAAPPAAAFPFLGGSCGPLGPAFVPAGTAAAGAAAATAGVAGLLLPPLPSAARRSAILRWRLASPDSVSRFVMSTLPGADAAAASCKFACPFACGGCACAVGAHANVRQQVQLCMPGGKQLRVIVPDQPLEAPPSKHTAERMLAHKSTGDLRPHLEHAAHAGCVHVIQQPLRHPAGRLQQVQALQLQLRGPPNNLCAWNCV